METVTKKEFISIKLAIHSNQRMKEEELSYKEGYLYALQNSKSLLKIADLSAQDHEYGIACSLSILSAEEAIKACMCLHKHKNPNMELDRKIFSSHEVKHDLINSHLISFIYFPKRLLDTLEETATKDFTLIEFICLLITKKDSDILTSKDLKPSDIRLWRQKANQIKNSGFYVGFSESKNQWHSPKEKNEEDYCNQRRFASALIELGGKFEEFYLKLPSGKL